jgi:hypothetical protein
MLENYMQCDLHTITACTTVFDCGGNLCWLKLCNLDIHIIDKILTRKLAL